MIIHNITLNVNNQNVVNTGIAVSQGDKGKIKFIIYVKDGDNYLSGAVSAEIAFNTPNGYIVTGNAVVENNSYTYVFEGNELQAAGDISAVITLTFLDGRVSSCGFTFYCRYNPMYDRNIDAGPYFGEIESLKSAAENALSDANGAVAQANEAKNAAEIAAGNAEAVAGIGIATTEKAGISKPDGTTLGIDAAGILRVLVSGLKIKDTNGLIGTVNADVLLQALIDDITNRVVNQILTKSMLINNGLTTESGKYPLDAAFGKTLADKDTELASSIAQLNSDLNQLCNYKKIKILKVSFPYSALTFEQFGVLYKGSGYANVNLTDFSKINGMMCSLDDTSYNAMLARAQLKENNSKLYCDFMRSTSFNSGFITNVTLIVFGE